MAPTGGICNKVASCVVTEFGTIPQGSINGVEDGTPYPTSGTKDEAFFHTNYSTHMVKFNLGFGAAFILAHEIGHSLGMRHDSSGNRCDREGFIMSPTGDIVGETKY